MDTETYTPTAGDITERVVGVIADVLECDPGEVDTSASLESLGMDSLDAVQLVMELEDEFDISIEDEDAENILAVDDIVRYVKKRSAEDNS